MIRIIHILTIFSILLGGYSFSQCPRPSKVISPDTKNGWGENSQSKSGKLRPGDEYEMRFIAQPGIQYRVQAAAGNKDFTKDNVNFKLVTKEVNRVEEEGKVFYKSSEVVLFDSESAAEEEQAIFASSKTQKLSIKVMIEGQEEGPAHTLQCAVVLIEAKKAESIGLK